MTYLLRKIRFVAFFLLIFSLQGNAQDPIFSQFYANPTFLNPALAGASVCPRFVLNYRNQWPALSNSFVTYSASYDQYINPLSGSVAVMAMRDQIGSSFSKTSVSGVYAYRTQISRDVSFSAALQATYLNASVDFNSLVFPDQMNHTGISNPTSSLVNQDQLQESLNTLDFSGGVVVFSESFYGGLSLHHVNRPEQGFVSNYNSKIPVKVTAHAGVVLDLKQRKHLKGEKVPTITPNILYQKYGKDQLFNYGCYVKFSSFVFGGWVRHSLENLDALIVLAGVEYDQFRIGYSYDLTLSSLRRYTGGAHEISLGIHLPCPKARKGEIHAIPCPAF